MHRLSLPVHVMWHLVATLETASAWLHWLLFIVFLVFCQRHFDYELAWKRTVNVTVTAGPSVRF